jgi:hypothetical protein
MEQPPFDTPTNLKEYLSRVLNALQLKDNQQLQILTALPTKPSPGRVYYFSTTISPRIPFVGAYVYKLVPSNRLNAGDLYTIAFSGTSNFVLVGAANSNVGTSFVATGTTTGTGLAYTWGYLG